MCVCGCVSIVKLMPIKMPLILDGNAKGKRKKKERIKEKWKDEDEYSMACWWIGLDDATIFFLCASLLSVCLYFFSLLISSSSSFPHSEIKPKANTLSYNNIA